MTLHRGDFLEGFYDDWVLCECYRLQALLRQALERLMIAYEEGAAHNAALTAALRLLEQDPLREDAHRAVMRAYCRLGGRDAALEQYRRCRDLVRQDLGAEPMVETRELYQAILEGRFVVEREGEVLRPAAQRCSLRLPRGAAHWTWRRRVPWSDGTGSWPPWTSAGREPRPGRADSC